MSAVPAPPTCLHHSALQSFDGEIALVRLWSCILPDDIIEAHVSGANRIYPALTENIKTVAAQEMAER